ncbi:hypothetical protein CKO51_21225 [Rhodopirellula sp. SM50]|nr:hypothetical protein CKO51_21225 [Rhodopirellula sp. SM50]
MIVKCDSKLFCFSLPLQDSHKVEGLETIKTIQVNQIFKRAVFNAPVLLVKLNRRKINRSANTAIYDKGQTKIKSRALPEL